MWYSLVCENNNELAIGWDLKFRRILSRREVDQAAFGNRLDNVNIHSELQDQRELELEGSGMFTCRSYFHFLIKDHANVPFKPYNIT